MKNRTLTTLAVLAATSLASTAVYAQAHDDSFTYQGTIMDGGVPANGFYDISFLVIDSEVGGAIVLGGAAQVPNVEVVDGLFEAFVDFNVSGTVFDSDQTRWLQINVREVGDLFFTALSPRQRMAPAPIANYALRSGSTLDAAYNNGNTIFRGTGEPAVEIRSDGTGTALLSLGSQFENEEEGQFYMFTDTGGIMFAVEQDVNTGGGAYFHSARNSGSSSGFIVDGNFAGTESARVTISGDSISMFFNTSTTGDNTAVLPVDAINSSEILNETGAAETATSGATGLTSDPAVIDVIDSVTINCPSDGYVLVLATAEVSVSHLTGAVTTSNFGVSAVSSSIPINGDIELRISSTNPTGSNDFPVTVHSIFAASAGANTFYFLGDKNFLGGAVFVLDRQLTAVFIPTSYGALAVTSNANQGLPDEFAPITAPMSNQDISNEREAALRADLNRQQRELDAMKAQMQQLLEQSHQTLEEQSQG